MAHRITLIPGDGIGPEVTNATVRILDASGVKIEWEKQEAGAATAETKGTTLPDEVLASIRKNKVAMSDSAVTAILILTIVSAVALSATASAVRPWWERELVDESERV